MSLWVKPTTTPDPFEYSDLFNFAVATSTDEISLTWYRGRGLYFYLTDTVDGSSILTAYDSQDLTESVWTQCIISVD